MKLDKFEKALIGKCSTIKADARLEEDDLREYSRIGQEKVIEELNATLKKFNTGVPELKTKDDRVKLWGTESGDIHVDIVETKDEIEVSVFEIKRRWKFDKGR